MNENTNEKALILEAQQGNKDAFDELFKQKARLILYNAYKILGDIHEAEDVAQEASIVMFRKLSTLNDPEKLNAWLYKIVKNKAKKRIHNKMIKKEEFNIDEALLNIEEENSEFLPQEFLEEKDLKEYLLGVIDELPAKKKEAIYLFYFNDMTYSEIAEAMDTTTSTVSTNLLRAKAYIKEQIEAKTGSQLDTSYSLATLPVMTQILREEAATLFPDSMIKTVAGAASSTVATQSVGSGLGLFLSTSTTKIIVAVVAGTIAIGGAGIAAVTTIANNGQGEDVSGYEITESEIIAGDTNETATSEGITTSQATVPGNALTGTNTQTQPGNSTEENTGGNEEGPAVQSPTGQIHYHGGDCDCGHVNPTEISFSTSNSTSGAPSWTITKNSTGAVVYSGSGSSVTAQLKSLYNSKADGAYTITFSAKDKNGYTIQAKKTFRIDTGIITPNQYA